MKFKCLNRMIIGSVLSLSCLVNSAHAGLITIGGLSSNADNTTSVITDTFNNLEWMRWSQSANYNHAQALLQSASGWTIAGANQANLFLDALYNGNGGDHLCADNDSDFLFCADNGSFTGEEYTALLYGPATSGSNAAWFYDDEFTDAKAGYVKLESGTSNRKYNTYGTIADTELHWSFGTILETEGHGLVSDKKNGWLMYRATTAVPEPSTLAIFAIALLALAARRFKQAV